MVEIPRTGQNHLIACAGQSGQGSTEGLVATLGDSGLFGRDGAVVSAAPLAGDFGAQLGQSKNWAVQMGVGVV